MTEKVSLYINATDIDESFLLANFLYLLTNSNYPFFEKLLILDQVVNKRIIRIAEEFQKLGYIDAWFQTDYQQYEEICRKYCTPSFKNFKGNYAYLFGIEQCQGDYILHYDIDMLLYTKSDCSWVKDGLSLLKQYSDLYCIRPSPPLSGGIFFDSDKSIYLPHHHLTSTTTILKERGYRMYRNFSSRCFLIQKGIENFVKVTDTLEHCLADEIVRQNVHTGELIDTDKYFMVHARDKWVQKKDKLLQITKLINRGIYPQQQLFKYDLEGRIFEDMLTTYFP